MGGGPAATVPPGVGPGTYPTRLSPDVPGWQPVTVAGHPFALCLTHDVDRVRKSYQTLYYALRQRDLGHLRALLPGANPYWQFEDIVALEAELGVRSALYFLDEQSLFHDRHPREWLDPEAWKLYAARYDVDEPRIDETIRRLDRGGWEIGLHGSYESYRDRTLLAAEKRTIERVLGHAVRGGRQHYLNLDVPETWRHQRAVGLRYDTSLGSSTEYGFAAGHDPIRPFDDGFVVFPLTLMEIALPDPGTDPGAARAVCDDLLEEALELGGWVGPPGELYDRLDHPGEARQPATDVSRGPASDGGPAPDTGTTVTDTHEVRNGSGTGAGIDPADASAADDSDAAGVGSRAGGSSVDHGWNTRSDGGRDTDREEPSDDGGAGGSGHESEDGPPAG